MKAYLIAAAVGLLPVAAQAQVAAGSVPDPFQRPAAGAPAAQSVAAPAPAQAAPALSPDVANAQAEETLRAFIAGAQAGAIDYSMMTDNLAAQLRPQQAAILPVFTQLGAVQAIDHVGSRTDIDVFAITFANAATEWQVSLTDEGKMSALRFREAE